MADIETTVNGMAKKDIIVEPPAPVTPAPASLAAAKIKAVAKEMARPWQYGDALHRYAKRHGIALSQAREIWGAVRRRIAGEGAKSAEPVVIEEG